ncbi:MAG: hypothetical protein MUF51_00250 [Vicinamibacteria bacterium]|jgi:hypothetical protein|nr:hypothetical protein [Vicinamibacteria bacterium]
MERSVFAATPTIVGSFPHKDAAPLVSMLLARLKALPAWPQVPARDWRESMYVQYSEGLPGATLEAETERLFFQKGPDFEQQLEEFYQAVVGEDVERLAISPEYAQGLHLFLEALQARGARAAWAKGQVTGPFSFAMTVTDERKRSLAYTPELAEIAAQGMGMKARWMARRLKSVAERALVVLDEPYLCSFGSVFVNVPREDVLASIAGAVRGIQQEGALAGLHCCGNTDWSLVLATGVDVINFDAYEYFQGLSLYPDDLKAFFARGGLLSWGIIPTSKDVFAVSVDGLVAKLLDHFARLEEKGIDRRVIFEQAILTPACGMGSQSLEGAAHILDLLVEVAERVRATQGNAG